MRAKYNETAEKVPAVISREKGEKTGPTISKYLSNNIFSM